MIIDIWNAVFYQPLYNALVFLVDVLPGADVGFAVIILTILVKVILFPLSKRSIISQAKLKALEPKLKEIKKKFEDKQEQAKKTFELYKGHKVNPFSGCLLIIIQLPVIIALYLVFFRGLDFDKELLYSFVTFPEHVNLLFLSLIDLSAKSLPLALLAGLTQFIHGRVSSAMKQTDTGGTGMKAQLMKSMNVQMKYVLPIFIAFIAYQISAAVALYWATSNIFAIIQEYVIKKKVGIDESLKEVSDKDGKNHDS